MSMQTTSTRLGLPAPPKRLQWLCLVPGAQQQRQPSAEWCSERWAASSCCCWDDGGLGRKLACLCGYSLQYTQCPESQIQAGHSKAGTHRSTFVAYALCALSASESLCML